MKKIRWFSPYYFNHLTDNKMGGQRSPMKPLISSLFHYTHPTNAAAFMPQKALNTSRCQPIERSNSSPSDFAKKRQASQNRLPRESAQTSLIDWVV
jgi:hypothetical protein